MTPTKKGYAVQLTQANGNQYLSTEAGLLPVVFSLKRLAVRRKQRLECYDLKARVVKVRYTDPVVVGK